MAIIVGSARVDERGKYNSGAAGDQLQKGTNDTAGEVSMQNMYTHSKGWYVLRPKSAAHAKAIAERMKAACKNAKLGYDQYNRLGVIKYGIDTDTKTECDCSSLVRQCVKEATGVDAGNFTTANECTKLAATGLFESKFTYVSQAKTPVYDGDVLVTKTKGHTVIVVSGNSRAVNGFNSVEWIKSLQRALNVSVDGVAGSETHGACPTIRKGYTGTVVKLMQQRLEYEFGYSVGGCDGIFGSKTLAAVKKFQKAKGLEVDGIVGKYTWKALLRL